MEQGGISIISPPVVTENSVNKSKSINITLSSSASVKNAAEKLKAPWLEKILKEDASWCDTLLLGLAEIIGTGILVFIGCMGCVGSLGITPSIAQICLGFGFAVMIAIQCVGHISGAHINPSITIASLILGKTSLPMTIFYIAAQCIGGLCGYGLLKAITPMDMLHAGDPTMKESFCMTDIHRDMTVAQGLFAEFLATGILVLFACGAWDSRNANSTDSVSIRFGLCVAVLCFAFVPYTGCSLNPARTFGPALWNGYWRNHWVFWAGPISGAVVAALVYRFVFSKEEQTVSNRET